LIVGHDRHHEYIVSSFCLSNARPWILDNQQTSGHNHAFKMTSSSGLIKTSTPSYGFKRVLHDNSDLDRAAACKIREVAKHQTREVLV
jgi:hypothetical protein